ncbi:MAG: 50S ribosomal protein L17 [Caldilineaceae bacterium]|nr:50S ribosomal protein L17 [Caldilineaceae bacterium]
MSGRVLGRKAGPRKALFRNLVRELYLHERIMTTEAKARAIRSDAERFITKAKRGLAENGNQVHAQRQLVAFLNDKTVAKKVFDEIAPRYTERNGGYTRMIKVGKRQGDAADMVILELVGSEL